MVILEKKDNEVKEHEVQKCEIDYKKGERDILSSGHSRGMWTLVARAKHPSSASCFRRLFHYGLKTIHCKQKIHSSSSP